MSKLGKAASKSEKSFFGSLNIFLGREWRPGRIQPHRGGGVSCTGQFPAGVEGGLQVQQYLQARSKESSSSLSSSIMLDRLLLDPVSGQKQDTTSNTPLP